MRQVEFADHDFDVDAEIVFAAEDFDDASAGTLGGGGPVGDFHVDDYAFQIVPVGAARGFVAEDAVYGFLLYASPRARLLAGSGNIPTQAKSGLEWGTLGIF